MSNALPVVRIKQVSPKGPTLVAGQDEGDELTGGVGGWETLDRPRRSTAMYWKGLPVATYKLPLVLDGMGRTASADASVEQACAQLLAWGRPSTKKGETIPPPVLQVTGSAVPVKAADRWVIDDIAWGDEERNAAGHRVQQMVTLTLLQYEAASLVTSHAKKAAAKAKAKKGKTKAKTVTKTWRPA